MKKPIFVTQPSVGALEECLPLFESIWESAYLTNNGPMVRRLESELESYLKVKNVVCLSNGTAALLLALKVLGIKGEVITTPFTFIATASTISWAGCKPVFVDICEDDWNIDVDKIEQSITENTTCILPVHVFSAPCNIDTIMELAQKNNLKVIYDAAHAFGVKTGNCSVTEHGDISCISFHATKIFNSVEGGACITDNDELAEKMRQMRYFGYDTARNIVNCGINAKMTEIHAAIGLTNLKNIGYALSQRKSKSQIYFNELADFPLSFQKMTPEAYNFSYMPTVFKDKDTVDQVINKLSHHEIYPRRYFNPSLNTIKVFPDRPNCPVSERIADRILCLPLFDDLSDENIVKICQVIKDTI